MAARLGSASGPLPWPEVFLLDYPQITQLPEPAVMRPMGHSFASGGWFERVRANRWAWQGRPHDVGNRTAGPGSRASSQTAQRSGSAAPALEAKLMLPRVQAWRLRRTRSLEMLDDDGASMLTAVLDAGAGDGKAMLVRSWCTERPASVLWMTLDAGDDDLMRGWCTWRRPWICVTSRDSCRAHRRRRWGLTQLTPAEEAACRTSGVASRTSAEPSTSLQPRTTWPS